MSGASADRSGQVVMGRYRIVRRLAVGGMGVVYLARIEGAKGFVRPAVIKQMLPDLVGDEELVRDFVREAQILSELRHPGIVSVLDFSVEDGAHLMALEYVHGYHVGSWLKFLRRKGEAFDPALALHIVTRVLDALSYVHARTDEHGRSLGIVHRDVSPSNVLIDVEGRVRLLDFGVARIGADDVTASEESDVIIKGKLAYLAPELLRGERPSIGSDLFACGVVLHELLSGRNELRASTPNETLSRVMRHSLSPLEPSREDLPRGTDAVIRHATAREPGERFESAGAMAKALRALTPVPERELEARLGDAARRAFKGGLPELLELPPLDELERAWRDPSDPSVEVIIEVEAHRSEAATMPEPLRRRGASGPRRWAIGALAAALLAAGLGATALMAERAPPPSSIVVVDRRSLDAPVPQPESAIAASAPPAVSPAPVSPVEDAPPPAGEDPATRITRAFQRRRAAIERCFAEHATSADARRLEVSIRLRIDREGRVESAEIVPEVLSRSALGACLLHTARQTRFGPQPAPLSFRIPITVRR